MKVKTKTDARIRRHKRIRQKVSGTADRPRVALMISNRNIYVQVIDDASSVTLASISSGKDDKLTRETAKKLGAELAGVMKGKGISTVVVDRGGFRFHGRLKEFVDSMVESGVSISSKEDK